ncbi:MoaD/ThiS family protein [Anaerobranca gottschalkii]|uniref:MoaD/ThiS family protein n=1 Tax=Anaerobranca gottschalkii TaxID=108328 RepID=UPI000B84574B|nr:MoaD/ThiS family protein [Anaerobranca gottschalkii]
MNLTVRLFATLRENRGKELHLQFDKPVTPRDIIERLNILEEDVAILLVNGRDGSLDTHLEDNDIISIFPPVGGG